MCDEGAQESTGAPDTEPITETTEEGSSSRRSRRALMAAAAGVGAMSLAGVTVDRAAARTVTVQGASGPTGPIGPTGPRGATGASWTGRGNGRDGCHRSCRCRRNWRRWPNRTERRNGIDRHNRRDRRRRDCPRRRRCDRRAVTRPRWIRRCDLHGAVSPDTWVSPVAGMPLTSTTVASCSWSRADRHSRVTRQGPLPMHGAGTSSSAPFHF